MTQSELIKKNQDSINATWTPLLATALVGIGVVAVANSKNQLDNKAIIDTQADTMASQYMAKIQDYIKKMKNPNFLPTATAIEAPALKDIQKLAKDNTSKCIHVKHPLCLALIRHMYEVEYLTIAMVRRGCQLTSWKAGSPGLLSPMELWEDTHQLIHGLVMAENSVMLRRELTEEHAISLRKMGDDLELLVQALYDEFNSVGKDNSPGSTCADQAVFLDAIKKSSLSIGFIKRFAVMESLPFIHFNDIPADYLCSAVIKAAMYSSVKNMRKFCIFTGESSVKVAHELGEALQAKLKESGMRSPDVAEEISKYIKEFMHSRGVDTCEEEEARPARLNRTCADAVSACKDLEQTDKDLMTKRGEDKETPKSNVQEAEVGA